MKKKTMMLMLVSLMLFGFAGNVFGQAIICGYSYDTFTI